MKTPQAASLEIVGHAIVSADGMIATQQGIIPSNLIVDADQATFQNALDLSALVVLGRKGHEMHPSKGRRRLVVTSKVKTLEADPNVLRATFWNPAGMGLVEVLRQLSILNGTIAITGGQRVFDLFLAHYTKFMLAEAHHITVPKGLECFADGHPRHVLAKAGLLPVKTRPLTSDHSVTETVWQRADPSRLSV